MTGTSFLLLALTLVVAAGDWHAVFHGGKTLEYVCKPLTMVLLFATTLAIEVDDATVRSWFLVAIVLCLIGDVLLMLPQDLFVFGLASFCSATSPTSWGCTSTGSNPPASSSAPRWCWPRSL